MLGRLHHEESGTTAIEYALIGSLVSCFIIYALLNVQAMVNVLHTLAAALVDGAI